MSSLQSQSDFGELDALIVGAGFGGVYMLHHLRGLGISVKVFEAGSDLGGVWHWNCYPGARVDSNVPVYEFSMEELWKDWTWTERFPGYTELRQYFKYLDSKLDLKRDIRLNTRVISAHFDAKNDRWDVKTQDGATARPRHLVLCAGFAAKEYVPPFKGLETFKGIAHHTAKWPQEGVDFEGKRVAVIGTGATGVQVIQELGPIVKHLTVLQRTPNFAIPMVQTKLDKETQQKMKSLYPTIYRRRLQTIGGYDFHPFPKNYFDVSADERRLFYEDLWSRGGFHYIVGNYQDILINEEANTGVYEFWKDKVRERLHDPVVQEILAPSKPPHPFGAKRPCLEQKYYEVYNQPNVELVDLSKHPIAEITPTGILTGDGVLHEVDIIVIATGFDSITGGITQIDIRGVDGTSIKEKWANGVHTYCGMTTANFPNMFFLYGPQAPTAFSNGPTCIEIQGSWVIACIQHMITKDFTRIEATREAEEGWRDMVMHLSSLALFHKAKSWYTGSNIPGKPVEQLNFAGGIPLYDTLCRDKAEKGYEGFVLSSTGRTSDV